MSGASYAAIVMAIAYMPPSFDATKALDRLALESAGARLLRHAMRRA